MNRFKTAGSPKPASQFRLFLDFYCFFVEPWQNILSLILYCPIPLYAPQLLSSHGYHFLGDTVLLHPLPNWYSYISMYTLGCVHQKIRVDWLTLESYENGYYLSWGIVDSTNTAFFKRWPMLSVQQSVICRVDTLLTYSSISLILKILQLILFNVWIGVSIFYVSGLLQSFFQIF